LLIACLPSYPGSIVSFLWEHSLHKSLLQILYLCLLLGTRPHQSLILILDMHMKTVKINVRKSWLQKSNFHTILLFGER
jgi:hypothetical protein